MNGNKLNENPQLPDTSTIKNPLQSEQDVDKMNFIGKIVINNTAQVKDKDIKKAVEEYLVGTSRDTSQQ